MRSFFYVVLFILIPSLSLRAQTDPQAVKVLDSFSAKASGAPSILMKFNLITIDVMENIADTLKGSVLLSGDKYRLELPENIIFFNGESSWSYLPDEREVTVTNADKNDDSFMSRPSSIFSIYKSGYKNRLIEETANSYIIDLYPEEIKSDLIRIRLTIGKSQLDLKSLEYKRRDGITATLQVLEYNLKVKPSLDSFVFPKEKHKNVEIVDMR